MMRNIETKLPVDRFLISTGINHFTNIIAFSIPVGCIFRLVYVVQNLANKSFIFGCKLNGLGDFELLSYKLLFF
ncbi:hypothetical protein C1646_811660, partial [Rhizophagus diaphanus]